MLNSNAEFNNQNPHYKQGGSTAVFSETDKGNTLNKDEKIRDRRDYNRDNRGKEILERENSNQREQNNKSNQNNQNIQREHYKRDSLNFNRPPSITPDKKDIINNSNDEYYTNKNNRKDIINRDNRKTNYQSYYKENDS